MQFGSFRVVNGPLGKPGDLSCVFKDSRQNRVALANVDEPLTSDCHHGHVLLFEVVLMKRGAPAELASVKAIMPEPAR